ncbi:hypothetical protein CS063_03165 [Sporanaerobium hydrogeniformans]|uniref:Uncharacterized protein n=2 Tax=Sporanaerobium hydrogeniformans TaxID=3072179 RepID=A0AC61DIC3_9FIRM|nr:hypothetical protein CS063_03165 [Sporanaerobium hydrogeniformans]
MGMCLSFSLLTLAKDAVDKCPNNNKYHQIVNKEKTLSSDYKPSHLVIPNVKVLQAGNIEKNHMEKVAALHLEELFQGANKEKISLVAVSGYRSYKRQNTLYNQYIKRYGKKYTDTVSAQAGKSEHQTGLAIDVSAKSVGYDLTTRFGMTQEGKWLAQNAYRYGFIIRYPKGKEQITGYSYEPWHIRYVGTELAEHIYKTGLTLEEIETCCLLEKAPEELMEEQVKQEAFIHTELEELKEVTSQVVEQNTTLAEEGTDLNKDQRQVQLFLSAVKETTKKIIPERKK